MPKTVLLTGSAGFIGSHTAQHFLENTDWTVIGLDSFRHKGDSLRVTDLNYDWSRFRTYNCDLAAPISDRLAKQIGPVDHIINMASESHVDRSIEEPVPFVQNNVNLTLYMLEYARAVQPESFVQISTDEVYGPAPIGTSFKEWSDILPSNPYSASKAAQEAIAISYWRTYGVPLIITNTVNNFGERQDSEKFVPLVIGKILRGEKIQIHETNGVGSRNYVHARNHADALLYMLTELTPAMYPDAMYPDRYNITGHQELTNLEMAQLIAEILDMKLDYEIAEVHTSRPGHDPRYDLDGALLASLGWSAPVPLRESLERTVRWTQEYSEWS